MGRSAESLTAPAAPVGEPLCRCGHPRIDHRNNYRSCCNCEKDCQRFVPAPAPVSVSDEAATYCRNCGAKQ